MKISKKNKAGATAILKLMSIHTLVVFCDFSNISSQLLTQLRLKTVSQNICIKVFPNSLLKATLKTLKLTKEMRTNLTGQLMHVYGKDIKAISQLLKDSGYVHTNKVKFAIQNNQQLIEKEDIIRIANLPTKSELTAKLYLVLKLFVVKFLTILRTITNKTK
ncbi:50S ribosomal protein L10 [Candidatus Tremblaya phenacola]|uniref:50S ribosomal protein L10 n=1 Tax=Candidatus Tremblayella phenacoccinincola TaxID=1010676 RepID=UPI00132FFA35|nr:50S ribosomal protein L10 [Candidatus Tremblaya phenacola]KAH0998274.1 hypothetical protein FKM95_000098 [Candidatus Tremblaya phenacola]